MSQANNSPKKAGDRPSLKADASLPEFIFEQAPVGIYLTDKDGRCTYANQFWLDMAGLTLDQALGEGWKNGLHPDDRQQIFDSWENAAREDVIWDHTYRFINQKNHISWVRGLAVKRQNQQGDLIGYLGININITDQKQTEFSQKDLERTLGMITENSKEMFWQVNTRGKVVFISPSVTAISGYTLPELDGMKYSKIVAPPASKQALHLFMSALNGEGFSLIEIDVLDKNGGRIPVETSVTPIRKDGKVIGIQGIARDITKRKQAQQEREALLTRLREAQQLAGLGTWEWNLNADKEYWSDELFAIYGRDSKKGVPHPDDYQAQHHPDDRDKVHETLEQSLSQGIAETEYRLIRHHDHAERTVRMRCRVENGPNGLPARQVGTIIDITEQKQNEQKLNRLLTDLNKAQAVSHVGSWHWDIQANSLTWSNEMYRIFGINRDRFSGDLQDVIAKTIHPDDVPAVEASNRSVIEKGQPIPLEYRIIRPDGEIRTVWAEAGQLVKDKNGKPAYLTGIVSDITERKKAENVLRASEARFRAIFEQAAIGVAMVGKDAKFLESNQKICQITGYTPEELRQMTVMEITLPDDMELEQAHIQKVLAGEIDSYQIEKRFIHKDGHTVWITLFSNVVRDLQGQVEYAIAAIEDITARKQLEMQRDHLTTQLQDAQRIAHLGSWEWDLRTNQEIWSQELFRIYGINPQGGVPPFDRHLDHIHPDDHQLVRDASQRAQEANGFQIEYRIIRQDNGEVRWVQTTMEIVYGSDHEPLKNLGTVIDITERKKAEIALAQSLQHYASLVEDSPMLISRWQPDGTLTFANRAYCEFLGKSEKELIGSTIFEEIPEDQQETVKQFISRLSHQNPGQNGENRNIRHDGQARWMRWTDRAFFDNEGNITHYQSFGTDIHERRMAEEERNRLLYTLQEAQRIAHVGSWEWDIPNDIYYWSDELFHIYGRNSQDGVPVGEDHVAVIHPDDLAAMRTAKKESLITGTYACEYRLFRYDNGEERIVNAVGEVEFDQDGKPILQRGTLQDVTDLRKGKAALEQSLRDLKESERILATLMGNLPGMAYRCENDADWTMRFVSQGCVDLTGYAPEELLNNTCLSYADLIHPDDRDWINQQVEQANENRHPFELTYRIHCKDGLVKWVWEKGQLITRDASQSQHLEGFINDITDQITATDTLRESQQRYQSVVDDSPVLISRFQPDGTISFTNSAYSQFFIGKDDGMIGENIFQFILASHHASAREYLASFTQEDPILKYDDQVKRHDGAACWLRWTDRAFFDEKGNITEYQAFGEDITAQKESELALQASEQRYQSVVEDAPLMIIRYLPDGTITFTNSQYRQFYTGGHDGLPWKTIYDKYTPAKQRRVKKDLESLSPANPIRNLEELCERFDGQQRWLRWKDVALFDEQGNLAGYQAFGEDIHDQYLAELKQKEAERDLKTLMANLPGMAYRADAHGRFIFQFLSQGCKPLTGYDPQEFLDDPHFGYEMIMGEEYKEPLIEQIESAIAHHTPFEFSYRIITKSGEEKWVWERGSVVLDEAGKPHHIEGFITDITDRVLAEEQLNESETRFRTFMDNFPANAYIKDAQGKHIFVNLAASMFAGIPQTEYIGKKNDEIYPAPFASELDLLDQSVIHDQIIIEKEGYFTSPKGEKRYQRDIKFPIQGLYGEKLVGGIALDLTSQKEAEERILEKARFEQLLARVSTTFLNMDPEDIDDGINDALKQIGVFLDIDRVVISRVEQGQISRLTHIWSEKVLKGVRNSYDIQNYPWLFSTSVDGKSVIWSVNDGLPDHVTKTERDFFRTTAVQSLASLPIQSADSTIGSIIFSDYEDAHKFTPELVESLHLFAQIISNALTLRNAQREIRESEQRYRSVVEDAPVLINRYKPDGTITFANQAYCNFMGKRLSEIVGKKYFEFMPDDARQGAKKRLKNLSADNPLYFAESKVLRADGQERWLRWTVRCLLDPQGKINLVQSFGIDFTDQRLAAERITASERKFRSLFTEMANGFALFEIVKNPKGDPENIAFVEVNPAFEQITGLHHADITGKAITEVLPDFDQGWLQDYIDVALHDLTFERKEFNQRLGIYTDIRAFSPHHGQCAVLLTDITEQETLYHQIELDRNRTQQYLDTVQSIMIAMDSEGILTLANPKACEILGFTEEELLGKNWFDTCLPEGNIAEIKDVFQKIMRGEMESVQYYENKIRTRAGEELIIAWHNAVMKDRDGKFLGVLSSGEDITVRKAAERRFQTLFDISSRLIAASYDQDTLQVVANEILEKIQSAQAVSVWIYDQQKEKLAIEAIAGFEDKRILGLTANVGEGVVGQVAKTKQPMLVHHAKKHPAFSSIGKVTAEMSEIQCMICVPLIFQEKLLGAISVDNLKAPEALNMNDLNLVESIANQLAGIVENMVLFEQLQQSQVELRALSQRLLEVHETERRAVALDLHDHFGQILTTFKLSLRPEAFINHSEEEQRARLAEVTTIVDEMIEAAEDLSLRLRPSILDDLGITMAFEWHIQRFARQANIPIHTDIQVAKGKRFSTNTEITLYRVLEESLSNALRHGNPAIIEVDLREKDDNILLMVRDDGSGFSQEEAENKDPSQTGLIGMQERVRLLNGVMHIDTVPEKGTTIEIKIPIIEEGKNADMENTP